MMYDVRQWIELSHDETKGLCERVRAGDDYAMRFIIQNYLGFIIKRTHHIPPKYKMDAIHDILPSIMRSIESYDDTLGYFAAYLDKAINLALMSRSETARWATKRRDNDAAYGWSFYREPLSPRRLMINKEYKEARSNALRLAMSNLSLQDQYIIKQKFIKGRTSRDIAEEEMIKESTMCHRIQRILKRMRRDVEHYADDLR